MSVKTAETINKKEIGDLNILMAQILKIAKRKYDGHFAILGFTTNYRVGFGTPPDIYELSKVPAFPTLREALYFAIENRPEWDPKW